MVTITGGGPHPSHHQKTQHPLVSHPLAAISSPKLCISMTTESSLDALRLGKTSVQRWFPWLWSSVLRYVLPPCPSRFNRFLILKCGICDKDWWNEHFFFKKNLSSTDCVFFFPLQEMGAFSPKSDSLEWFWPLIYSGETRLASEFAGSHGVLDDYWAIMTYHELCAVDLNFEASLRRQDPSKLF